MGRKPLYYLHTYGCQGNAAEGERLAGLLEAMGYIHTQNLEKADFALLNTCAVRENAEHRLYGNLGILIHVKKKNPKLLIGICGCMTQQEEIVRHIQKVYPGVDLVFGTHTVHRFPEMLYLVLKAQKSIYDVTKSDGIIAENLPIRRQNLIKASVPIMFGCNNFCSYCIVPYVKGRERSRRPQDIIKEIRALLAEGYKEILLLGQNVNSYQKNSEGSYHFAELLREINALPGDFRIRFMTSHPKDLTDDLISAIAECDKVCKHLHLPLQSGNNHILEAMNRRYTVEQYLGLTEKLRSKIPRISLTSDIIVGFPGETYQEFSDTLALLKQIRYDSLFTFIYSKRPYTKAALMEDPVSLSEKTKWMQELISVQNEISLQNKEAYLHTKQRILVEAVSKSGGGMLTGRTDTNLVVDFEGTKEIIGSFANVTITKVYRMAMQGVIEKEGKS